MALKVFEKAISEIEADMQTIQKSLVVSENGIVYSDSKPLRFCTLYETIIAPTLPQCRTCGTGRDVLGLKEEDRDMWLNSTGNINDINDGKSDKVLAHLLIAKIKNGQDIENKIVHRVHEGAKQCPKYA